VRLPTLIDYLQAVQLPQVSFVDEALRGGRPRRNPLKMPSVASGGFALTFDIDVDGRHFAVRCFHKHSVHLQERYAQVSRFVSGAGLQVLVEVQFVPSGIRVDGVVYPIVRMPWVDGARLGNWIEDHLDDRRAIAAVRQQIADGVEALRSRGAAHGDLQHGNILVAPGNVVRFIDYDGMYLPELARLGASEQGHPNYQHPGRADRYDASLDLFAAEVIDLSMTALSHEPALFAEFNSGENLILSATDFADPIASPAFARLAGIPAVASRSQRLAAACTVAYPDMAGVLAGSAPPPTLSARSAAGAVPGGPPVIAATDRARLLARLGDTVTVVGRVQETIAMTRRGQITFINFGSYLRGDFTVVAWDRCSRQLASRFGDVARLEREWLAVTGMVTGYRSKHATRLTPQIELRSVQALRKISAAEANRLLGQVAGRPPAAARQAAPPSTSAAPSTTTAIADDLTRRVSRLYAKPGMTGGNRQPTPSKAAPPSVPPPRQPTPARPPVQPPQSYAPVPPQYHGPPLPPQRWMPYYQPPPRRPPLPPGIGAAALILSVCCLPAGLILGVVVLSQGQRAAGANRVCATIAIGLGVLFFILWLAGTTHVFTSM